MRISSTGYEYKSGLLRPLRPSVWRPSSESCLTGIANATWFRVTARTSDGAPYWSGWFQDREEADNFIYRLKRHALGDNFSALDRRAPSGPVGPHLPWLAFVSPSMYYGEWIPEFAELPLIYECVVDVFLTSSPGSTQSYTVTPDWRNVDNSINAIGGGGGCASIFNTSYNAWMASGGGGGACAVNTNVVMTGGASFDYVVGLGGAGTILGHGGDSWFGSTSTLKGVAGRGHTDLTYPYYVTGGLGGLAVNSVGAAKFSGGNGGNGDWYKNAGGGAAGPAANGGNGHYTTGGGTSGGSPTMWAGTHGPGVGGFGSDGNLYGAGAGGNPESGSVFAGAQGIVYLTCLTGPVFMTLNIGCLSTLSPKKASTKIFVSSGASTVRPIRNVDRNLAISITTTVAKIVFKSIQTLLTVTSDVGISVSKRVTASFQMQATSTALLASNVRTAIRSVSVTVSTSVTKVRSIARHVSITISSVTLRIKNVGKAVVTSSSSATLAFKSKLAYLVIDVTSTSSVLKSIPNKLLIVIATVAPESIKNTAKAFTTRVIAFPLRFGKTVLKTFATVSSSSAAQMKAKLALIPVVAETTTTLHRAFFRIILVLASGNVTKLASITKSILRASASSVSSSIKDTQKALFTTVTANVSKLSDVLKAIGVTTTTVISSAAQRFVPVSIIVISTNAVVPIRNVLKNVVTVTSVQVARTSDVLKVLVSTPSLLVTSVKNAAKQLGPVDATSVASSVKTILMRSHSSVVTSAGIFRGFYKRVRAFTSSLVRVSTHFNVADVISGYSKALADLPVDKLVDYAGRQYRRVVLKFKK